MKGVVIGSLVSAIFIFSVTPVRADTLVTGNSSVNVSTSTTVNTTGGVTQSHQTIDSNVNGEEVHLQSNKTGENSVTIRQENGEKPDVKIQTSDPQVVIERSDQEASATPTSQGDDESSEKEVLGPAREPFLEDEPNNLPVNTFADRLGEWIAHLSDSILAQTKRLLAQTNLKLR